MNSQPRRNPFAASAPVASSLFQDDSPGETLDEVNMDTDINFYGEETAAYSNQQTRPNTGAFSMSDQKPSGLVINTPSQIQNQQRPVYKQNTLGAHTRPQQQRAPLPPQQRPAMPQHAPARPQPPNNPFHRQAPMQVQTQIPQPIYPQMNENQAGTPIPLARINSDRDEYDPSSQSTEAINMSDQSRNQNYAPRQNFQQPATQQKARPLQNVHNPFGPSEETDNGMQSVNLNQREPGSTQGFEDDPPLLEDLDIDLEKIKLKFMAIMTQRGFGENDIAQYDDMNGPILVAIIFGILLTLKGKLEFGSIYGFGLTGCVGLQIIINLMSRQGQYVDLFTCASNLGYSLLPFCFLAAISIFIDLNNFTGSVICACIIAWSTTTATRLFEYGLDMADKKYLIAYPIILFYGVFTLLTIF